MTKEQTNITIWNEIYKKNQSNLSLPNEMFVRMFQKYVAPKLRIGKHLNILDYGFGTGANLLYMLDQGANVQGVEVSERAIHITKEKLSYSNKDSKLSLFDGEKLPYEEDFFDVVVAWQVLYYNDLEGLYSSLNEINRVLKKGGLFIGTMCATGDVSHEQSTKISPMVYRSKVKNQENAICIILDDQEVKKLFLDKKPVIGEMMYKLEGITSRHWVIKYEN